MPVGQFISVGVYVGQQKLPEYRIKDRVYSEVDLNGPSSYTVEEDGQKYPVLPFKLELVCLAKEVPWITVYLDGQVISSRPLKNKLTCDGVKVGNEIRELLFTLPRMTEDQVKTNPLADHAGTIRVVVKHAQCTGDSYLPVYAQSAPRGSGGPSRVLPHFTKKDVQRSMEHAVGSLVAREGRPTFSLVQTGQFRHAQRFCPTPQVLEEVVLYYRPRIYSRTPKTVATISAPPALKEDEGSQDVARTPLSDVGNMMPELNAFYSAIQTPSQEMSSTKEPMCDRRLMVSELPEPSPQESHETGSSSPVPSQAAEHSSDSSPEAERYSQFAPSILPHKIKRRESSMIPPELAEHSETVMIPPEQIKRRESNMILPDHQQTESGLIPLGKIKSRKSCSPGLIPLDQIKRRESFLPRSSTIDESGGDGVEGDKQLAIKRELLDNSYILVSDSDDEDTGIYLYDHEDNSVVYMGDDDCCMFEISQNISLIDLEDELDLEEGASAMSFDA
ncbi:uncharacterized protein [Littorina saxatilis]|uniref:Uncharacterized protein n=1 Tax=Littorina saxatilis TaxID=31220 RepID=A0AAN9GMV6_9CAEN